MKAKYQGLTKEEYGLKKNPIKAKELLKQGYALGQPWALQAKFYDLEKPSERHAFVEEHINNKWAIKQKLKWAIKQKHECFTKRGAGYEEKNTAALAFLLESYGVTQEEFAALQ